MCDTNKLLETIRHHISVARASYEMATDRARDDPWLRHLMQFVKDVERLDYELARGTLVPDMWSNSVSSPMKSRTFPPNVPFLRAEIVGPGMQCKHVDAFTTIHYVFDSSYPVEAVSLSPDHERLGK